MNNEIRIDLKAMARWILQKWKLLIPGFLVFSVLMAGLLYMNEVIAYRHETSKLYSMDTCLQNMSDSAVREVKLTLAMEQIMREKEDELEGLRQKDDLTEEQFLRMENLLEEIDKIRSLSISYRYSFNNYQSRYYDLLNGMDENDMTRPYPTLTQNMVFGGIVIGAAMLAALCILLYLLSGYLHSEDEIRMNFGYRVNTVDGTNGNLEEGVKLVLESDKWDKQEQTAILGAFDREKNNECLEVVKRVTKGNIYTQFLQDTNALTNIKESKQAIIVARVNDTKLRTLTAIHETMKSLNVEILGVLLIKE